MTIENTEKRKVGRPGVTYKDVEAAANTLIAQNRPVTQDNIIDIAGGSNSTVGPLLRQWKSSQAKIADAPVILPDALNRAILGEIEKQKAEAREPLIDELKESEKTIINLENDCNAVTSERDELLISNAELTTARDTYLGESNQKTLEIDALKKEIEREQARSLAAQTETAKASLKIEQLIEKNDELKEKNSELMAALKESEVAKNAAERSAEVNASKLDDANKREQKLDAQVSSLQSELSKINGELARITKELSESSAKNAAMQETLNAANRDIQRLTSECETAKKHSIEYQNKFSELTGKLDMDKTRITDLELKLDAEKQVNVELKNEIANLKK
jgi:chromosome segregation ATPase